MKSQAVFQESLPLRWSYEKDLSRFSSIIRSLYRNVLLQQLFLSTFTIALSIVFITFPRHFATTSGPASSPTKLQGTYTQLTKPTPKPAVAVKASDPLSCSEGQPNLKNSSFARCPTVFLNYTKTAAGPIDKNTFNTYVGAPEGNHEAQLYTDQLTNVAIENGTLILRANNDPQQGYSYTSARIDTKSKFEFLYGKLVVRATLPTDIGAWPAIWMLPANTKYADLSAVDDVTRYQNGGEIDIAESVGATPHLIYGIAHSVAHPITGPQDYYGNASLPDNDSVFHDYGIEWTPTQLSFTVDGTVYFTYQKPKDADFHAWPFDQPFYLIMNLALGGTWGGIDRADFPVDGVDTAALPSVMRIASINYYPYNQK